MLGEVSTIATHQSNPPFTERRNIKNNYFFYLAPLLHTKYNSKSNSTQKRATQSTSITLVYYHQLLTTTTVDLEWYAIYLSTWLNIMCGGRNRSGDTNKSYHFKWEPISKKKERQRRKQHEKESITLLTALGVSDASTSDPSSRHSRRRSPKSNHTARSRAENRTSTPKPRSSTNQRHHNHKPHAEKKRRHT